MDGLFVGIDFFDVGKLCAVVDQQIVVDLQPEGPNDGEIVFDHQIINFFHRTCGRILDRQNAVLTQTLLNRKKNAVPGLTVG